MTNPSDRRAARRNQRRRSSLEQIPFRPAEVLDAAGRAAACRAGRADHDTSMRILEEIGMDFLDDEALDIWAAAGAKVDRANQHVWMDRGLIMDAISHAPAEFTLRARNPAKNVRIGGANSVFVSTSGTPFVADLDNGRREGTLADLHTLVKLVHACNPVHVLESQITEPQDLPVQIRHLERGLAIFTLTDKPVAQAAHGRSVASDCLEMAAIVFGGMDEIQREPVFTAVINANSPLRYDSSMLGGIITYARGRQPLVMTPFILAGAMSPITMAAAVAQQNAEALAGIALAQLVSPGTPVIYGGFTTNTDMTSGSPAFGTPEGAWAFFAGAQLARRYRLPYRGSGGLNTAKVPDAQAAYETQMCLWPTVMSQTNYIMHAAGWLESGLVCSFEKFILDVEGLAMMQHLFGGVEISTDTLAFDSIKAIGPGGHHFGSEHTLARYEQAFYRPIVSDRQSIGQWEEGGSLDAAQRANRVWKELLQNYEQPPIDPGVEEELRTFVAQRSRELGAGS